MGTENLGAVVPVVSDVELSIKEEHVPRVLVRNMGNALTNHNAYHYLQFPPPLLRTPYLLQSSPSL